MAEAVSPWDKLSHDEIGLILRKVANGSRLWEPKGPSCRMPVVPLNDLAAMSAVNKKPRAQCREGGWYRPKKVVLSDRLPMDFFAWLLKHAWQLEALVFMGLYYEGFMAERSTPPEAIPSDNCTYDQLFDVLLLRSQGSLKELTIIACSPELASYLLDWTVRECPDLRSIKCRYNDLLEGHKEFGTLASKCPKVEHFEYWEDGASEDPRKELSIETVKAMVKGWPNLRCINMNRGIITLEGMCCLQGCKKLERAHIQPEDARNNQCFLDSIEPHHVMSTTLKEFYLYLCNMSLEYDFKPILQLCPNVEKVVFEMDPDTLGDENTRCETSNQETFREIQKSHPRITFLDVDEKEIVVEEWFP